jgi:hypothetical protein
MVADDPHLSIGVLAYNEESRIGKTLQTLFAQDVFERFSTEVVVVPNGCTDETATVARRMIQHHQAAWSIRGSARVDELVAAGKANAWNKFVHELSSPRASVLILMDADIALLNSNTISSMVEALESHSEAVVCGDRPVKDIEMSAKRTIFQRLLVATTPEIDLDNVPLCGQLYCALSQQLRLIRLPIEIMCEDGFLRALLLTQGFTRPENPRRIVLDSTAMHGFASVATPRELFKHEVWVVAGSIVNMLLFNRFSTECSSNRSAMVLMKEWQDQDPEWLQAYIQLEVRKKGWRLLPRSWWTRRWSRLGEFPSNDKLRMLPIVIIAAAVDMLVFIAAIRRVRRGRAFGYWGRK